MWYVYVIQHSDSKELYFGMTNDVERRLMEHNLGKNSSTHRMNGGWTIVYYESYRDKQDAINREARLKQHGRAKQELLKRAKQSLV